MRKVVSKVLIEVEGIVPLGGIEQLERKFKQWLTNANMHGIEAKLLLAPEFKDVENEEVQG